jgi:hypothetical protein
MSLRGSKLLKRLYFLLLVNVLLVTFSSEVEALRLMLRNVQDPLNSQVKGIVTGSVGNVSSHDHGHGASSLLESHGPGLQRGPHDHRGLGWGELQVLLLMHRGGLGRLDRTLSGSGQRPLPRVHGGGLRRLDRARGGSVHCLLEVRRER